MCGSLMRVRCTTSKRSDTSETLTAWQMSRFDVAPSGRQVFDDETTMAMLRLMFGAQQQCALEGLRQQYLLDPAFYQEGVESLCVLVPTDSLLPVRLEEFGRGSKERIVDVLDFKDRAQEYARSSRLAKPASGEVLCRRTSTRRRIRSVFSASKKSSGPTIPRNRP